ncbi:MAG: hypothetical protein ABSA04_02735 [Desulfobaccales bacterium]
MCSEAENPQAAGGGAREIRGAAPGRRRERLVHGGRRGSGPRFYRKPLRLPVAAPGVIRGGAGKIRR